MKNIFLVVTMLIVAAFASAPQAHAGILDGTDITFLIGKFSAYAPPGPPSGSFALFDSASGVGNGSTISPEIYNELNVSGNSVTISINTSSVGGVYDVIEFPDITLDNVTISQIGVNRYGGTFGPGKVSFDAHDIYLDISGMWNVYDTRLVLSVDAEPNAAPEPASIALFGAALTGLGILRRKRG